MHRRRRGAGGARSGRCRRTSSAQRCPAERDAGLDRRASAPRRRAPRPGSRRSCASKQLPARHATRPGPRCRRRPRRSAASSADPHLAAGADEHEVGRRPRRRRQHVGAAWPRRRGRRCPRGPGGSGGCRISAVGPSLLDGDRARLARLVGVGRADDRAGRAWPAATARCSIGWWVGPSSPTPTESWVQRVDDLGLGMSAASRTAPAHVVAEDEERAADGQHAAVQRHAVHDAEPMACSRMPKWIWRPAGSSTDWMRRRPSSSVPVLPVRSAPPPTRPGHLVDEGVEALAARPTRVATFSPRLPASAARSAQPGRPLAGQARPRTRSRSPAHAVEARLPRLAGVAARGAGVAVEGRARRRGRRTVSSGGRPRISLVARDLVVAERRCRGPRGRRCTWATGSRCGCAARSATGRSSTAMARRSAASSASRSLATSPRSLDVPAVGLEALGRRRR